MFGSELLAVSKAGHDKGEIFVVIGEAGERYLIADGKSRTLANPKQKNKKHLQPVRHLSGALLEKMSRIERDEDVRRILKLYTENQSYMEVMHVEK